MARAVIVACCVLLACVALTASAVDCPCGFTDPTTGAIWTDALLTYFNETDVSSDIVMTPAASPYSEGEKGQGDTGTGTQDWSNIGGQVNEWEDAFGATYRSGVLLNNTALTNSQLEMYVQPAEMKDRIVYGAECESCEVCIEKSND